MGPVYEAYVSAGLPPARFWEITPRLLAVEMAGAQNRMIRERELVWFGAMLPRMKKPPPLEKFAGRITSSADRVRRFHDAWDKIDQALSRNLG